MCACSGWAWMSQNTAQELCMSAVRQVGLGARPQEGRMEGELKTLSVL